MKKRKKNSEQGDWLNTYADMVTLLLCFFVLLYSISSVDQDKWKNFVLSINPQAAEALQEPKANGAFQEGIMEEYPEGDADAFEEMFRALIEAANCSRALHSFHTSSAIPAER